MRDFDSRQVFCGDSLELNGTPNEVASRVLCIETKQIDLQQTSFLLRYGLRREQSTFESRESATLSAAILYLAVCVRDVVNKAGICGGSVHYIMSKKNEPTWL